MTAATALRSGFARVAARPSAFIAEIAWRWSLGAAVSVLLLTAVAEYLDSIEVFNGHLFAGAGSHLPRLAAVVLAGIVLLAVFASAAGRNAALLPLMADWGAADDAPGNFCALLWLSFLRGALLLAAALAVAGAWLIAAFASGNSGHVVPVPDAYGFWLVFSPLALLIGAAWAGLYWIVGLAQLPAVAHGIATRDALARAVELIHDQPIDLALIGIVFGVLRLGSLWLALQLAFAVVALGTMSRAAELGLLVVIAAMYYVFSDYLFVSRMGAYAAGIQDSQCAIQN